VPFFKLNFSVLLLDFSPDGEIDIQLSVSNRQKTIGLHQEHSSDGRKGGQKSVSHHGILHRI